MAHNFGSVSEYKSFCLHKLFLQAEEAEEIVDGDDPLMNEQAIATLHKKVGLTSNDVGAHHRLVRRDGPKAGLYFSGLKVSLLWQFTSVWRIGTHRL